MAVRRDRGGPGPACCNEGDGSGAPCVGGPSLASQAGRGRTTVRAWIDEDACIGCGVCSDMCPEVFSLEDEVAIVIVAEIPEDQEVCAEEAADSCPVDAISID